MKPHDRLRCLIAQETARLIIEGGIDDYYAAKQKAARHFGVSGEKHVPSNEEVDEAIRQYQRLFRSDEQEQLLHKMRTVALRTMEFLVDFSPRLAGGVAEGTAGRLTPVVVLLFAETPEEVMIRLLNANLPFKQTNHEFWLSRKEKRLYPAFELRVDQFDVNLKYLPRSTMHQVPKEKRSKSLTIAALRTLVGTHAEGTARFS